MKMNNWKFFKIDSYCVNFMLANKIWKMKAIKWVFFLTVIICCLISGNGNLYQFADFDQQGNSIYLISNGYKFVKHWESRTKIHWRCAGYKRYKCPCRAHTQMMDGYNMVQFKCNIHCHPRNHWQDARNNSFWTNFRGLFRSHSFSFE